MSRPYPAAILGGLALGAALHGIGFSDYGELHRMFVFADLRLIAVFGGSVGLVVLAFRLLPGGFRPPKPLHPGVVPGAALFGLGWVLCGACPTIPLVQLGEGKLYAVVVLIGVLLGTWLGELLHARYLGFDRGGCG